MTLAECAPGVGQYCDYEVRNAAAHHVWETGSNNGKHFAAVKDATGVFA